MLRSLKIENFCCFQSFELQQLGRLNLLVGMNNSGKTSILEAIQLLVSQSNLTRLVNGMISRGEYVLDRNSLDIRNLFYGHKLSVGSKLSISGNNSSKIITISVEEKDTERRDHEIFEGSEKLVFSNNHQFTSVPLSPQRYLDSGFLRGKEFLGLGTKTHF
ncbi:MAG: AAA family ATPase [Acaryochloridaceae cyanobacterium CSU_3_4]|nr:AAA family ATPase [Acaryochloridaceae cyanobacterium CSU_3_4]